MIVLPTTETELRDLVQTLSRVAQSNLRTQGRVVEALLLIDSVGQRKLITDVTFQPLGAEMDAVREQASDHHAVAAVHVAEVGGHLVGECWWPERNHSYLRCLRIERRHGEVALRWTEPPDSSGSWLRLVLADEGTVS